MADMVKWAVATKASFAGLGAKDANTIYFLSDTFEIFKGANAYAKGVEAFDGIAARPAVGAEGRLYIDSTNKAGYVYANNAWTQVLAGVATEVVADSADVVTGGAVKTYVDAQIADVTGGALTAVEYNQATKELSVTKAGQTTTKKITGVATGISYNNGKLVISDVDGAEVGSVNLELERYLQDAYYDEATASLVFEVKVEGAEEATKISVPAAEFVTLYEGVDTNTIDLTVSAVEGGANTISAAVKVSAEAGNTLVAKEDGLFVPATDISGKMDLVGGATANDIATLNAAGQAVDSGKAFGAAAFAATPGEALIPTEASVAAYVATKEAEQNEAIAGVYATKAEAEATNGANAEAFAGLEEEIAGIKEDYVKVADIVTVVADETATTKVASEAAVVAALTWQTV